MSDENNTTTIQAEVEPTLTTKMPSEEKTYDEAGDYEYESDAIAREIANGVDIENGKPNPFVFLLTILVSFSGFLFGYDTGYISGALVAMGTDLGHAITSSEKELITSATSLGALLGGIVAGTLADVLGRKWVTIGANTLFVVGAGIQTGAHSVWTMIGGRFVMGWGVGIASLIAPLYISEMAPSRFRGRLVILNVLAITGGQVIAYAIGAGLETLPNGWRVLVGLGIVPAVAQMVMFVYMPETPRYLVRRGQIERARHVVRWIYSSRDGAIEEEVVIRKVKLLEIYNNDQHPEWSGYRRFRYSLKQLYFVPGHFRALIVACGLQGIQQLCGFNSLMYFSATIFQVVGFNKPTAVSLIVAGTNMAFTILAFLLIDIVGRRRILLCTVWGMSAALVLNAVAFHFLPPDATQSNPWAIVILIAMMLYVAFYAAGIGNVPWQQSELFPIQVRGLGTSMATATNWAGNLIIGSTFLTMMDRITPSGTFGFYAGLCLLGEVFVFFLYPETSYLTLEAIQDVLTDGFNIKRANQMSRNAKLKHSAARCEAAGDSKA
ncbi:general substrate transporter [Lipomyces tetrasporus]|uniref:General substrate transporter n=1 Tax=Lipomyces tetrasporus TaxID=54092 RepID=A0AAD7VRW7_9ASCO|nr:general substrate transporter [Lipomyces tetrasporus]KAJ8099638.1 general substrate transporter [Lipomyces tetrasporus]